MIISDKYKFVFIKTRKVAGSSLEQCIYPYLSKKDVCTGGTWDDNYPTLNYPYQWQSHLTMNQVYNNCTGDRLHDIRENYFKFTIERNPWDKMVSYYFWYKKTRPTQLAEQYGINTFQEFIREIPGSLVSDWGHYHDIKTREVNVDKIYRFEDLSPLINKLAELGIDIKDDFANTRCKDYGRPHRDYRGMYKSDGDIIVIQKRFRKVIDLLGYEYDG
jgi:hypothetical protein